jgi:hypothetical protein
MGVKYGNGIVRKALRVHVDAANPKSYPGSGTSWYNLAADTFDTSNVAVGTMGTGVSFSAGPPAAMVFDGTTNAYVDFGVGSDYFTNTTGQQFDNPHEIAVESWTSSTGLGTSQTLGGICGWTYGIRHGYDGSGGMFAGYDTGTALSTNADGVNHFTGEWVHFISTQRNAGGNLYVNGELVNTNVRRWQGKTRWLTNNCRIGRDMNNTIYNLDGKVAIVRIYYKWISPQEAKQNFNAERGRFGV